MASIRAAMVAFALAAGAPSHAAPTEDWVRIGTAPGGDPIELDRKSIVTAPDGLTEAWWRVPLAEPREDGTAEERHLELIDCRKGTSSELALLKLDETGEPVEELREPESAAIRRLGAATPGTTGETVLDAACAMRPRGKRR